MNAYLASYKSKFPDFMSNSKFTDQFQNSLTFPWPWRNKIFPDFSLTCVNPVIYVWEIVEGLVPNLTDPITCSLSDHRDRTCMVYHAGVGRLGTLKYNSFRWRSIRMFNRLPKCICMLSSCSVIRFKSEFDS